MSETILPWSADPAEHTLEECTHAVAAILAAGLLRLRPPSNLSAVGAAGGPEKSREFPTNQLTVAAETSVTVQAG